jgi:hypothetical protein
MAHNHQTLSHLLNLRHNNDPYLMYNYKKRKTFSEEYENTYHSFVNITNEYYFHSQQCFELIRWCQMIG